nr:MAG TPA: hypothetical protein [Caudoviricetes sp.]
MIVRLFLGVLNPATTAFVLRSQLFLFIYSVCSPFSR